MGFIFDLLSEALAPDWPGRKSVVFTCSLRVIDGSQGGLRDGWHDGEVTVQRGRLEFVVGYQSRDGIRALFRSPRPILVTVDAVGTERQRRPDKDDGSWNVNVDSEIVELATGTATLEWAVPTKRLEFALERLRSSPSETPVCETRS